MFFKLCCKHFFRWLPLIAIVLGCILFFYFRLYEYLSLKSLQTHQELLDSWAANHFFLTLFLFVSIYCLTIAMAIPSGFFFELLGGFLFGTVLGTFLILFSVTLGGTLLFLAVKISLAEWLEKKTSAKVKKMENGFRTNAFNYIITLRLIPIFPFWLVNIVAGILKVRLRTFVIATCIGIFPPTLIYASLGSNLHQLFVRDVPIDSSIIFEPQFLYPLIGLGLLVILPILYDYFKKRKAT